MTASLSDREPRFLRRAGLPALLLVLAVIAGMHILTGAHNMHMAGSGAVVHAHHTAVENVGHDNQHNAGTVTTGVIIPNDPAPTSRVFSCVGGDPCADMSAIGGSCFPSGSTGSLAAPPPPVSLAADTKAPAVAVGSYAYLPEGPSPADLCISRT